MNVHRITEIAEQLLGAAAARLVFVNITGFAADQFLILKAHGSAADPFVSIMDMNVIKFSHGLGVALAP